MSRLPSNLHYHQDSMLLEPPKSRQAAPAAREAVRPEPRPADARADEPTTTEDDIASVSVTAAVEHERAAKRGPREGQSINLGPAIWLVAMHVAALAAPWTFTWSAFFLTLALHWITGGLGICLGFHRLLTHTGFVVPRWLQRGIAVIGTLAGEGGPVLWTANHRRHHAFSDHEGDPHSPHDGSWWAHMFWLAYTTHGGDQEAYLKRWAPDLAKDRFMMGLEKFFLPLHILFGVMMCGIGYLVGGWYYAASYVIWTVAVRMVFVLHTTWFVNSAAHLWGYQNYKTRDDSRNLWWVGLLTYGEGWHNNHHAHPRLAQHGHKWWEVDATYMAIRLLRRLGLAKDVVDLESVEAKKRHRIDVAKTKAAAPKGVEAKGV